jgi:hypothetical protein
MKHVEVIRRDMKKVGKIQPDWRGTQGRAILEERKIFLDVSFPAKTVWSERLILEHERAHFVAFDAGFDDDLTPAQEEMLADWLGLVRTPDKCLHINELYMKRWLLGNYNFKNTVGKVAVFRRILDLLGIGPAQNRAALALRMLKVL